MLKIYTLGDFDIKIDDRSILQEIGNHPRLMKLFKYFLTFQGKKLLPENIIEDIWKEDEFKNPLNVLRTQISRIRNLVDLENYGKQAFFEIVYIDGYYVFNIYENCIVDFLVMQSCIDKYHSLGDMDDMINVCRAGVSLYKGDYLGELGLEDWVIPVRNRFDRMYLNNLSHYLQLLKDRSMDNLIISICEEAMSYKPYEEIIHIYFIESLINVGQNRAALDHYKYFTSKLYNDLGVVPSNQMKILYRRIKSQDEKSSVAISLNNLDEELRKSSNIEGALLCDKNCFQVLYDLEVRSRDRGQRDSFICILTIDNLGYNKLDQKQLKIAMTILLDIAFHAMRKGDVVCQWNKNQLLLLLSSLEQSHVSDIGARLDQKFKSLMDNDKIILNIKFEKI